MFDFLINFAMFLHFATFLRLHKYVYGALNRQYNIFLPRLYLSFGRPLMIIILYKNNRDLPLMTQIPITNHSISVAIPTLGGMDVY